VNCYSNHQTSGTRAITIPSTFNTISHPKFLSTTSNVASQKFVEYAAKQLNINEPSGWYKVNSKVTQTK
jgi:hypothetical protein